MTIDRLPEPTQTLYAELLDQCLHAEAERAAAGLPPGSFVAKEIKGSRYWYWQLSLGESKRQAYLGPESPALLEWIHRLGEVRQARAPDDEARDRLTAMLLRGGAVRESAPEVSVLALLADLGVFRAGGVLVGTHGFGCYGSVLGVRFETSSMRTEDIDIAHDPGISLALGKDAGASVEQAVLDAGLGFLPVPGLDPRQPSTSFKVRGRALRLDFLAPASRSDRLDPVRIPNLGISAQPLPFLDYLIAEPTPAVILGRRPVLVRVPRPGRFALHKLWTARERPAAQQVRARKDRRQAWALIEVLLEDRPDDLREAWAALAHRPRPNKKIAIELGAAPPEQELSLLRAGVGFR